jgi:hypothetical protein
MDAARHLLLSHQNGDLVDEVKDHERQLAFVRRTRAHLRHQPVEVRAAASIDRSAAELVLFVAHCHNVLSESHPPSAL